MANPITLRLLGKHFFKIAALRYSFFFMSIEYIHLWESMEASCDFPSFFAREWLMPESTMADVRPSNENKHPTMVDARFASQSII